MTIMSPLERLFEIESERAAHVAALVRLAEEAASILTSQPATPSAPARRPGRLIDVSQAAKIAGRGTSWVYSNGRRFGFAWRLASGSWSVDESMLRAFLHGESENREDREHREAGGIPLLTGPD